MELQYEYKNELYKVQVEHASDAFQISIGDRTYQVSASELKEGLLHVTANNHFFSPRIFLSGQNRFIFLNGETYCLKRSHHPSAAHAHVEGEIISPIGGKVVRVFVSEGDLVEKNQDLLIIESMKMEHKVKSPVKGVVMRVRYREGAVVDTNEVLLDVERDKTTNGQAEW